MPVHSRSRSLQPRVFGMPAEAIELGGVDEVLPLDRECCAGRALIQIAE